MGTNFHLIYNEEVDTECPCCGHTKKERKKRHLGKSSAGWCYALHVYPEEGLHTLADVQLHICDVIGNGGHIENEYGDIVSVEDWVKCVTVRSAKHPVDYQRDLAEAFGHRRYQSVKHYLDAMQAVEGPNNLLRAKIDGRRCIGHGTGTWYYFINDFS
jgi:hypothetical protein